MTTTGAERDPRTAGHGIAFSVAPGVCWVKPSRDRGEGRTRVRATDPLPDRRVWTKPGSSVTVLGPRSSVRSRRVVPENRRNLSGAGESAAARPDIDPPLTL